MFHQSNLCVLVLLKLSKTRDLKNSSVCCSISIFEAYASFEHIVSGGIATVHPNNKLTINAVEGASLEDFSIEVSCFNG